MWKNWVVALSSLALRLVPCRTEGQARRKQNSYLHGKVKALRKVAVEVPGALHCKEESAVSNQGLWAALCTCFFIYVLLWVLRVVQISAYLLVLCLVLKALCQEGWGREGSPGTGHRCKGPEQAAEGQDVTRTGAPGLVWPIGPQPRQGSPWALTFQRQLR